MSFKEGVKKIREVMFYWVKGSRKSVREKTFVRIRKHKLLGEKGRNQEQGGLAKRRAWFL